MVIIERFKQTWFYKLIKTSEAVFVGGGLLLGIAFGWFDVIPALVLVGIYVALNALGLSNSEPYVVRDVIKDEIDDLIDREGKEVVEQEKDDRDFTL